MPPRPGFHGTGWRGRGGGAAPIPSHLAKYPDAEIGGLVLKRAGAALRGPASRGLTVSVPPSLPPYGPRTILPATMALLSDERIRYPRRSRASLAVWESPPPAPRPPKLLDRVREA